jgi:hypothetical protein
MKTTFLTTFAVVLIFFWVVPKLAAAKSDGAFTIIYSADERGEITPCG